MNYADIEHGKRLLANAKKRTVIKGKWTPFAWTRWLHRNGEKLLLMVDKLEKEKRDLLADSLAAEGEWIDFYNEL